MSKISPLYLAPAVGFATWHLEHGERIPEVLERLRMHCDYCTLSGDEIRACVRRAISDLRRWQKIRGCCGWTDDGGCCSWDEAERRINGEQSRPSANQTGNTSGDCHRPGGG